MKKSVVEQCLNDVKKLYKNGVLIKDIATELNLNPSTLSRYITNHRDEFPTNQRKYRRLSEKEWRDIFKEWISSDKTIKQIAYMNHTSESNVRYHLIAFLRRKVPNNG